MVLLQKWTQMMTAMSVLLGAVSKLSVLMAFLCLKNRCIHDANCITTSFCCRTVNQSGAETAVSIHTIQKKVIVDDNDSVQEDDKLLPPFSTLLRTDISMLFHLGVYMQLGLFSPMMLDESCIK